MCKQREKEICKEIWHSMLLWVFARENTLTDRDKTKSSSTQDPGTSYLCISKETRECRYEMDVEQEKKHLKNVGNRVK